MKYPVLRFVPPGETGSEDESGRGPVQWALALHSTLPAVLFFICGVKWTTQLFPTQYLNNHRPNLVSQSWPKPQGPILFRALAQETHGTGTLSYSP